MSRTINKDCESRKWSCVRGIPNFPNNSQQLSHFLQNPATSCDTLQFSVIIYTKVALSCTTDGPLSVCCILCIYFDYTIPHSIPVLFHCHSNAVLLHFHIISFTISNVIYIWFIFLFYLPFVICCWLLGSLILM